MQLEEYWISQALHSHVSCAATWEVWNGFCEGLTAHVALVRLVQCMASNRLASWEDSLVYHTYAVAIVRYALKKVWTPVIF